MEKNDEKYQMYKPVSFMANMPYRYLFHCAVIGSN